MMNFVFDYFLTPFLSWGTLVFGLVIILVATIKRFVAVPEKVHGVISYIIKKARGVSYKSLIWLVLGFKVFYALVETLGQYYVWSNNGFTKLLLDQNIISFNIMSGFLGKMAWIFNNRLGYFLFYSWGRFWMEIAVSLMAALFFYLFLVFLNKHKERFFEEGEVELGFILTLAIGWSNFIVFLPLAFLSVILVSIFRKIFFKEMYTTLGAPFLLAALVTLVFGNYLIYLFGLMPLRV